jgi:hypothetical protein
MTSASAVWARTRATRWRERSAEQMRRNRLCIAEVARTPASCDFLACGGPAAAGGAFKPHNNQTAMPCTEVATSRQPTVPTEPDRRRTVSSKRVTLNELGSELHRVEAFA